jgi:hypothetical protein
MNVRGQLLLVHCCMPDAAFSHEFVFDGATGGGTTRGDAELTIDRAQVCIDGARAHDELFGNLGVGQPSRHQPQDFDLAGGETEWVPLRGGYVGEGWRNFPPGRLLR